MSKSSALITALVVAIVAFTAGALWQYSEVRTVTDDLEASRIQVAGLENELEQCRYQGRLANLRDMAGKMYLEVGRGNFDVASSVSTRFFDAVSSVQAEADSAELGETLQQIGERRDALTAQLARLEPAAEETVQEIYSTLHNATVDE